MKTTSRALAVETPRAPVPTIAPVGAGRAPRRNRVPIALMGLSPMAVLGGWEFAARSEWIPPVMLPPASEVMAGVWVLASADWFPQHVWTTMQEALIGFALAAVVATALASAMHLSRLARHLLYPYVIAFKLVPAVVLAPVFFIWFGFGIMPKVLVAASISFFVMVVTTLAGFDSVDEESRLLMQSIKASPLQTFRMLTFPTAMPYMFAGMKTGVTLSLVGALVAEFVQSREGLGALIIRFGYTFQQDYLFATIVIIAVAGLVLFGVVAAVARRVLWWQP
jgi:NitT/TauT family transport system permease protein